MRFYFGIFILTLFLSGCGDSNEIKFVKSGKFNACPDKTVEQAVNDFWGSPRWESGVGSDGPTKGLTLVNLLGKVSLQGKQVDGALQFIVDKKEGSFRPHAFETNGIPQPPIMMLGLISAMCKK
jgi:hypothetical protein